MPKRSYEGLVLSSRNYSEYDKIFTIFAKSRGLLSVIGKGVRKVSSKRGGSLDLLNHIKFSIYEGKGMGVVSEIVLLSSFEQIKNSLEKISTAYKFIEVLKKTLPEDTENDDLFAHLLGGLKHLETVASKEEFYRIEAYFFSKLLVHQGFLSNPLHCLTCGNEIVETGYANFSDGSFSCEVCKSGERLTDNSLNFLRKCLSQNFSLLKSVDLPGRDGALLSDTMIKLVETHIDSKVKSARSPLVS